MRSLPLDTFIYTLNWYFFVFFVFLALLRLALILAEKEIRPGLNFLSLIGGYSLGIYLIHPGFTFFLIHYCYSVNQGLLAAITLIASFLFTALSYKIVLLGRKIPLGAIAFGLKPLKK